MYQFPDPEFSREEEALLLNLDKLSKDAREAARHLSAHEIRFLVDAYYMIQDSRKRTSNQESALMKASEPHIIITWLRKQNKTIETDLVRVLDAYQSSKPVGVWADSIVGIGPVISAGLLAHIDIRVAQTAGQIWRFAGLDPTVQWLGRERAHEIVRDVLGKDRKVLPEHIQKVAAIIGSRPEHLENLATRNGMVALTAAALTSAAAKRPWNAKLKVVCWNASISFMHNSNNPQDVYGHIYHRYKEWDQGRNERGELKERAKEKLARFKIGKDTDAYEFYSRGMLPPAHIDARARRYAVKLFLAHWHEGAFFAEYGSLPAVPYVMDREGAVGPVNPPNTELIAGWTEARKAVKKH